LSSGVLAQDFTNIDLNAIVAGQAAETQAAINGVMQQAMQQRGPEIEATYYQCLQSGRYCGPFDEYALNYVTTNGFTDGGAWAQRSREDAKKVHDAGRALREAEAERGKAQAGQRDHFFYNQMEAGRQLMGNSTFTAPNGSQMVLPHTWQVNTTQVFQGNTYHVDQGGQYHVLGGDGFWYPLAR
jgi:hypothetical protein